MAQRSVGILDNDELTVMMLSHFLEANGLGIAWCATTGKTAIEQCRSDRDMPDLLLADMSLNDMTGVEVIEKLRVADNFVPALALTSFPLERYAQQVADAGGQGIVAKRSLKGIAQAVIVVLAGGTWNKDIEEVSFPTIGQCRESNRNPRVSLKSLSQSDKSVALTPREQTVMGLFSHGLTSGEAAEHMGISVNTVKTLASRVYAKLGAVNRSEAVSIWLKR
ncbi:response regulator transcription factor [Bifidobacterium sp. ESL0745]|uniref:response regulator transcription factor n=1 Tax=Bifidobacterium sp. ESL0745 TaxID=2983226 RepID=UPI0023F7EF85|nr:response regulator transcription factor [Bifidobacterium sp. ESL0745]MDF7664851.1 response regulator transcription factor [Bifidobacterium sp. ESL0745]